MMVNASSMRPLLRKIRWLLGLFIAALVLSGLTAFPLHHELNLLARLLGVDDAKSAEHYSGLAWWIAHVREGLQTAYAQFPFIAYGTDWLAFAHLIIAIFFVGAWVDPVRNIWIIKAGLIACVAVIPLALICGPIRGIPIYWRLIDCSFGICGFFPLWFCLKWVRELENG
jgi:hypothetical protein